jgi:molybdate transport system substrate-binding protein
MGSLKILSGGAVKRGVAMVAAQFERSAGVKVEPEFTPVPRLRERILAGEAADVIVATPAVMDELAAAGRIDPATRGRIGSSRMSIVLHADAPDLELPDAEAFSRALLAATKIVYNRASTGVYIEKLLAGLGLAQSLAAKIAVVDTGSEVMRGVEAGGVGSLGFGQVSEAMVLMDKGCRIKLAGTLPPVAAKITTYEAAAAAACAAPAQAAALARTLAAPEAKALFARTGIS